MVELELIGAIAGLIGGATGLTALIYTILKPRPDDRQAKAFEDLVTSHNELVTAIKEDIESLRREVGILRTEVGRRANMDALALEHKQQELAQRKQEHFWQKVTDVSKGVGFIVQNPDIFRVEEDDYED